MARDELPTTIPTVSPGWPSRTADLVAVAFCLLANAATVRLVGRAREALQPKIGTAHAALVPLRHRPARRLATILLGDRRKYDRRRRSSRHEHGNSP